jgi:catechol-2,3-dioxygenase
MNLSHLHIHVRSRSAAEEFYSAWLGMAIARRGKCLTFMLDGAGFALALMADQAPAPMPPWFHFGFRLPSAAEVIDLHQRMGESGIKILKALYQDDSLVSFRCADPDGYAIEVYWEAAAASLS